VARFRRLPKANTDIPVTGSYNQAMAKGWESKSVEEQQSLASETLITEEERVRLSNAHQQKFRKQQALQMSRVRVEQQMEKCNNDKYRSMLQQELDHLDAEMKKLG
jgi:hypothetical protein